MTKLLRTSIQVSLLKLAALVVLLTWLMSCGKEEDALFASFDGPFIKTGVACGLCAGYCNDTLLITPDRLFYKSVTYGESADLTTIQNRSFTQAEWDDLLSSVDAEAFNALDIESCGRCVDLCDRHYEIRAGNISNQISVLFNDTISALGSFQGKVEALRLSFQN